MSIDWGGVKWPAPEQTTDELRPKIHGDWVCVGPVLGGAYLWRNTKTGEMRCLPGEELPED